MVFAPQAVVAVVPEGTAFHADYQPLATGRPLWGEIACLPWDEEIFGFPVADLRLKSEEPLPYSDIAGLRQSLTEFSRETRAELISLRIPASRTDTLSFFMRAGFLPVELAEGSTCNRLRVDLLPKPRFGVQPAEPVDLPELLAIAGTAFEFGRYHRDPHFPRELANRRYVRWVQNALASTHSGNHLFVMRSGAKCLGFHHAILSADGVADLRLAAATQSAPVGLGLALYSEVLLALQQLGAKRFVSKISAANVGVVNLFASMGFRFSRPEYVLHWHSPTARHLQYPGMDVNVESDLQNIEGVAV